jgi:hypothetical protein
MTWTPASETAEAWYHWLLTQAAWDDTGAWDDTEIWDEGLWLPAPDPSGTWSPA